MRKKLIHLIFIVLLCSGASAQSFYAVSSRDIPLTNKTFVLNLGNCDSMLVSTCPPTNNTLQIAENKYSDIALDQTDMYFVSNWGSLYKRPLAGSACQYLGNFGNVVNAMVADSTGIIYGAGQANGICTLYKYQAGTFSTIGNFPTGFFSAGDLFFYDHRLFLTGTNALMTSSYLVEVDMVNPSQSCMYMGLQNLQPWAAFSVNTGTVSRAFIIASSTVTGVKTSSLIELSIPCKTIGQAICTYPYEINGAATYYRFTSTSSQCLNSSMSITGNTLICAGETTTLTASGSSSYTWSTGALTNSIGVSPLVNTTYTVSGIADGTCASTGTVLVTVLPSPAISIFGISTVCRGSAITLTASGASSYTWSTGVTTATLSISPTVSAAYTVSGQSANSCSSSASIPVLVNLPPQLSVSSASTCPGLPVTLYASASPSAGVTYTWQPGAITTPTLSTAPQVTTVYTVTAMLNGCMSSSSATVVLQDTVPPVTGFSYPLLCTKGESIPPVKQVNFTEGGFFSAEEPLSLNTEDGAIDLFSTPAGTYLVTYSVAAQNCISAKSNTAQVIVRPGVELSISPDTQVEPGKTVLLQASGASNYAWEGDVTLSCTDCSAPQVSPMITTRYCVRAESNGCSSRLCTTVRVGCEHGDLSLPNAFTPNGDGHNDQFCLQGWKLCVKHFSILIFSRWGEKVYESDQADFCWDGTYNGKLLESDVLIYTITASFANNERIDKKGNITLIR